SGSWETTCARAPRPTRSRSPSTWPVAKRRGRRRGTGGARQGRRRARVETSAGGVVYRRGEDGTPRFLLIRDPYGNWGLPKGDVEGGETAEEAALREVSEEAGLSDLRAESELQTIDWYFRNDDHLVHKFCHFFLLVSRSGEATPQEDEGISACVWLPLDEAVRTITYANAREVLRAAGERLGAVGADSSGGQ